MPKTRAIDANNGRSIKDFFKASQVPQRPKSSQPEDDVYEEIVVATASPRRQGGPTVFQTLAGEVADAPRSSVSSSLDRSVHDGPPGQHNRARDGFVSTVPAALRDEGAAIRASEKARRLLSDDSLSSLSSSRSPDLELKSGNERSKSPTKPPAESSLSVGGPNSHEQKHVNSPRASRAISPQHLRSGNASLRHDHADPIEVLSSSLSPPSSLDSAQFYTPQASQSPNGRRDAPGAGAIIAAAPSDLHSGTSAQHPPPEAVSLTNPTENASFSSAISLSSIPISTQSSSRRIVKDGIKGVTNSDSDDGAASDEELPDVWALLPAKRRKLSPPSDCKETASRFLSPRNSRSTTRQQVGPRVVSAGPSQPVQRNYKYNLMSMAVKAKSRKMAADRIAELEKSTEHDDVDVDAEDRPGLLEVQNAIATTASDVDDQERIALALERTEALEETQGFSYFVDNQPACTNRPFPEVSKDVVEAEPWRATLKDEYSRKDAFATGCVANMAMHFPLDPDMTSWMAHQLLFEVNESLCESYVETLRRAAFNCGVPEELAKFRNFYHAREDRGSISRRDAPTTPPAGLEYILRVVSFCAPAADELNGDSKMSVLAFTDFALINIDESICMDFSFPLIIANCMENMLDYLPLEGFQKFKAEVTAAFHSIANLSRHLRCRVIASLTAGTQRTFEIRQILAVGLLTQISRSPPEGEPRLAGMALIARSLDTAPDFALRDSSDYQLLQTLISVLDIAVGAGTTLHHLSSPSSTVKQALHVPGSRSSSQVEATKKHDEEVDGLVRRLRAMSNRIRGAGTTHLARTEAKSAIERLIVRLEYSVRSKPRPRKSAFGVSGDDSLGSLHRFLRPMGDGLPVTEDKSRADAGATPTDGIDENNADYASE